MLDIRRREFFSILGGAAAWPLAARAQRPSLPVVGFLHSAAPELTDIAAFLSGLGEAGYVEGRNVVIEYRWAQNDVNRLPDLAADLVHRRVAVIATLGTSADALAAKAATATVPIVFLTGADPVQLGLVASLNRPGGNVTGITTMTNEVVAKRLELLHRLVPEARRVAVLSTPNSRTVAANVADLTAAAASLGLQIDFLYAGSRQEIDAAFTDLVKKRTEALLLNPTPTLLFQNRRVQLALLAARHRIPVMYTNRLYAEAGGLMSYGPDRADQAHLVGVYTGRILKGEKPPDLPVMRATKFELVINQQAAGIIGMVIPPTLLAVADAVIE
jgi:putative ABC transport system substrate-binding protein